MTLPTQRSHTSAMVSSPIELTLSGTTLRFSAFNDADIHELDDYVQRRHIETAMRGCPADASAEDKKLLYSLALTQASGLSWLSGSGARIIGTLDGMARLVWQGVHRQHPELSETDVRKLLIDADSEEVTAQNIDRAREAFSQANRAPHAENAKKKWRKGKKKRRYQSHRSTGR